MKKLKINTSLEPMDEWTYESYVSDYTFENVCVEESLDNITIDGCKFSKCQFKDCNFSFIECMDIVFDHCEFENVHFNQCSLSRVHFISCRISGMELSQSLVQDTLFQLCKGHYCDFGGSTFKDCMFDIDDLTGSGFIQCELKKTSFDNFTQEDINLMMSHINSYKRKKLKKTPTMNAGEKDYEK